MSIQKKIDQLIKSLGSISIQDFVEISNFDEFGFYNLFDNKKISKNGHFITSPEITSLFGYAISNQFLMEFTDVKYVHLLELGPGNGTLLGDVKNYLEQQNIKISQISLLEKSVFFQNKIKNKYTGKINFLKNISDIKLTNNETLFIYSNEFFDAIGSKQFIYKKGSFYEIKIVKEKNEYKLVHELSLMSDFLGRYYLNKKFHNGDILEHSNLIISIYEELNLVLKKNFFFSATDYGYLKIPKKNTLRLVSNHQKINLFEKFDNVDYSFGVNFELLSNYFKKFSPLIISQRDLINNFIPLKYKKMNDENINKIVEIICGDKFHDMGKNFLNITFFQK